MASNESFPVPKWIVYVLVGAAIGIGAYLYFTGESEVGSEEPAVIEGPPA